MASLECECTHIEGHKSRGQKKLKAEVETNLYQEAAKSTTVDDLQEPLPSPSIKDQLYEDMEIAGKEIGSQNAVTAETDINRYQEAVKPSVVQNLKETFLTHANQDNCEYTDIEESKKPQIAVTDDVDINRNQEAVKPPVEQHLKETIPKHVNQKNCEYTDIEETKKPQIAVTDDVDINRNQEAVKPPVEQHLKETFPTHANRDNCEYTDSEETKKPQSAVTDDADINRIQESVNPPVVQHLKETFPTHANQDNCKYTDIGESKNHSQNAVTVEADLIRNEELVKPTTLQKVKEALPGRAKREQLGYAGIERPKNCALNTVTAGDDPNRYEEPKASTVQEVKETLPGRAKRESLGYTDIERPKNYARNTVTAGDDPNRYEEPKASTVQDQKETSHSHVKQDEQDEFFDVEGFECYEPNTTVKPGLHLNRFQEAKKSPTILGLVENLSNRFFKEGNRAKSFEDVKPIQSSMLQKSNNKVCPRFSSYVGVSKHREGLKKSGGASVVTLNDIVVPTPFTQCRLVRLKLKNKAKDKVQDDPEPIKQTKACIEEMFQSSEGNLDLEEDNSEQGSLERNERQLDEIFDGIEQKIRQLRIETKKKFRTLTPKQKKEVLKFWEAVEEFLDVLLDWISKMFIIVLEEIRQGTKIKRDEIRKVFEDVSQFLKIIF